MGYFRDKEHDFTIYDAPKGGGTTVRLWIEYSRSKKINSEIKRNYVTQSSSSYRNLSDMGYKLNWFELVEGERVCIKRDPIKRFKSCFKDKVIGETRMGKVSVHYFINNFDMLLRKHNKPHPSNPKVPYNRYHFAPQVRQFGYDKSYYTEVFDISEVNTRLKEYLQDKWKMILPDLHARNNKSFSLVLSPTQIKKLEEIYKEDYEAGWF